MEAVIFSGIQGGGKTTFYKERFFTSHVRINLDMLKTRHREHLLLQACVEAKQPFVVDNTNVTIEDRARYIKIAKAAEFRVIGYYFRSNIKDALQRNSMRLGNERIPVQGVLGTYNKLQMPQLEEGFDQLYYVLINASNEFVVQEWADEV